MRAAIKRRVIVATVVVVLLAAVSVIEAQRVRIDGAGVFSGQLLFSPDNTYDLGASGASRPRNLYVAQTGFFGSDVNVGATRTIYWTSRALLKSPADGQVTVTNFAATAGVGVDVTTDGTLKVRTRAMSADAQLSAASVRGNAVAFASLPTAVEGMLVAVTDATTNVWGATITGGGANHVLAYYNGTNWTVAGK
jgi:hypothetical protein